MEKGDLPACCQGCSLCPSNLSDIKRVQDITNKDVTGSKLATCPISSVKKGRSVNISGFCPKGKNIWVVSISSSRKAWGGA